MLRKTVKKTSAGNSIRYRVVILGDESEPTRVAQLRFLSEIARNTDILEAALVPWNKLVVRHNGDCWQAETETEVVVDPTE
jgi:hypothetical protein